LIATLSDIQSTGFVLTPSLLSYIFFPLSAILRRNAPSAIPDQILEKILVILGLLWEDWWWTCDTSTWEQSFMLCGAIIGDMEGRGKGKARDDETKTAAAQCLLSSLRERVADKHPMVNSATRLSEFQDHARTTKFIPILGETINSLLTTAQSQHMPLQQASLQVLRLMIMIYAPQGFLPSILPGVVSALCKVVLRKSGSKKWANGDITALTLEVLRGATVRSIGDDICIEEGAVRRPQNLEDLTELFTETNVTSTTDETRPYLTTRTPVWLRGTSSQLHIALNSLTPLITHPSPLALRALSQFSSTILATTVLTLPQSQPLLLSFLLSLSNSTYPSVSSDARSSLLELLSSNSKARSTLLPTLIQNARDNLVALPRILSLQADEKVAHIAGLIEAVCRLATVKPGENVAASGLSLISNSIGKLLGPTGGIEKWGWSLLSVLQFENPPVAASGTTAQLMLEGEFQETAFPFPEVLFKHVASAAAHSALVRMFRSLGQAGGDRCLFSVEWFANVGQNKRDLRSVAALWCACRLLEGVGGVDLDSGKTGDAVSTRRSKRLEKLARGLARRVAELWDESYEYPSHSSDAKGEDDNSHLVEHVKGIVPLHETLNFTRQPPTSPKERSFASQLTLHKAFSLHLLSITAGILQTKFTTLFLHVLYPILHSLVSPLAHLSSTALASLSFITTSTSYASIANLLFSNFDYALDAVSRRLSRRWLDVDATKVLVILVRLVGSNVVQKAGDVVEECFDRLDDFHGYEIIVEGLVEVLGEVIVVVKTDEEATHGEKVGGDSSAPFLRDEERLDTLATWYIHRNNPPSDEDHRANDLPSPRDAWHEDEEKADEMKELIEEPDPSAETALTPVQTLTKQIVSRSLYFLSHQSSVIRARILGLLSSSVPVLPESALLPSIHHAWPFILNRLSDPEPFVVAAAASLVRSLATHFGDFMYRRIWDDVWPRFRIILYKLDAADGTNALARRGYGAVGTESAYTHSHRLYRSLLKTMTAVSRTVQVQDSSTWQVILAFRRFLHSQAHEELQACARDLYIAIGTNNVDSVWLALSATSGQITLSVSFLRETKWDIYNNSLIIFDALASTQIAQSNK
jgi:hypothetical protein